MTILRSTIQMKSEIGLNVLLTLVDAYLSIFSASVKGPRQCHVVLIATGVVLTEEHHK